MPLDRPICAGRAGDHDLEVVDVGARIDVGDRDVEPREHRAFTHVTTLFHDVSPYENADSVPCADRALVRARVGEAGRHLAAADAAVEEDRLRVDDRAEDRFGSSLAGTHSSRGRRSACAGEAARSEDGDTARLRMDRRVYPSAGPRITEMTNGHYAS